MQNVAAPAANPQGFAAGAARDQFLPDESAVPRPGTAFEDLQPLAKYVRRIPFALTKEQSERLHRTFPNLHFVSTPRATTHSHPVLALERNECETEVIAALTAHNDDVVCDVGGAPNRHLAAGRARVHTVCPTLSPDDVLRHSHRRYGNHYCECDALGCPHLPNCHVLLFVHSIYYFSASQMLALLLRSRRGRAVSIHHSFENGIGAFGLGEAAYEIRGNTDEPTVAMTLGYKTYRHAFPAWLRTRYYEQNGFAMTWGTRHIRGDTHVVDFELCPLFPNWQEEPPVSFRAALDDGAPIGFVNLAGALTERPGAFTTFVKQQLELHTSAWVFGPTITFFTGSKTILVPKPLVDEVAGMCAGMSRTAAVLQTVIATTRNKAKLYNIPPKYLADTVMYCAVLGFMKNIESETALLTNEIASKMRIAETHRESLLFKFPWHVSWTHIQYAKYAATAVISALMARQIRQRYRDRAAPVAPAGSVVDALLRVYKWIWPAPRRADLFLVLGGVAIVMIWWRKLSKFVGAAHPAFKSLQYYPQRIASVAPEPLNEDIKGTVLPAFTSQLPLLPPRDGAIMVPPDLYDAHPFEHRQVLSLPGLGIAGQVPTVMAQNVRNQMAAINNRMLAPAPFDPTTMTKFRTWVLANMAHLFPGSEEHRETQPTDFNEWVGRFPLATQLNLRKAKARLETQAYTERMVFRRGMFAKVEKGKPATNVGGEDYDPRGIQSATDEYNVMVGPFIHAVSKVIRKMWGVNHFLIYTSGMSAEAIGALFSRMKKEIPHTTVLEDDASRWDKSMSEPLLDLCIDIMRHFGADHLPGWGQFISLTELLRRGMRTSGHSSLEVFYKLMATMKSGDAFTSLWNTIINCLMHCYIYCVVNRVTPQELHRCSTRRTDAVLEYKMTRSLVPSNPDVDEEVDRKEPITYARGERKRVTFEMMSLEENKHEVLDDLGPPDSHYFVCLAHGDDMLAFCPQGYITAEAVTAIAKELGFTAKAKLRSEDEDHLVEFCSALFWPTNENTYVVGPKPGRILSRIGWAVELKPSRSDKKNDVDPGPAFVRGVCLGLSNDVQHVPFAKELINNMIEQTKDVRAMYPKGGDVYDHKIHASRAHEYCDATLRFVSRRYGISLQQLDFYRDQLKTAALGTLMHLPNLNVLFDVDMGCVANALGMLADRAAPVSQPQQRRANLFIDGPVAMAAQFCADHWPDVMQNLVRRYHLMLLGYSDWVITQVVDNVGIPPPDAIANIKEQAVANADTLVIALDPFYAFHSVVAAPMYEEAAKKYWRYALHVIIGVEWVSHKFSLGYLPTALMHIVCSRLKYKWAVLLHSAWNLRVLAAVVVNQRAAVTF